MDRESSIPEDPASWDSARTPRGWILPVVAIVACGFWLFLRVTPAQKPAETRGLRLLDAVVHLPTASFKTLELLLPCAGTLSIALDGPKENDVSVFVVAPDELARMKAKQTFTHLQGFDACPIKNYRRSARLRPGRYGLVLMDKSPGRLSSSSVAIQVTARLTDLE